LTTDPIASYKLLQHTACVIKLKKKKLRKNTNSAYSLLQEPNEILYGIMIYDSSV